MSFLWRTPPDNTVFGKLKIVLFAMCVSAYFLFLNLSSISSVRNGSSEFLAFKDQVRMQDKLTKSASYKEFENGSQQLLSLLTSDCLDSYTVPNIVHYVWISKKMLEFHEYVSVISAAKFVKPCYILLHGDTIPGGKWWELLLSQVHNIIHVIRKPPEEIFGRKLGCIEHKADVMRLQILMEYSGIYADTDMYFLRSLDPLRNFTLTMSPVLDNALSNGLMIASKDSAFLKIWYMTYQAYNPKSWGANSVRMALSLSQLLPPLVHKEPGMVLLGSKYESVYEENLDWENTRYSVHLYARLFRKRNFDFDTIKTLNNTFGALTRYVLYDTKDIIYG